MQRIEGAELPSTRTIRKLSEGKRIDEVGSG